MVSVSVRRDFAQDLCAPKTEHPGSNSFDAKLFIDSKSFRKTVSRFAEKEVIFAQGDPAQCVLFLREGGAKLSVSEADKEAVLALRGPGDFLGESCLAGHSLRLGTATAIADTLALVIEKSEMIHLLHEEHEFSDRFIAYMLKRNIRVEEDLIDQLFNSSEKRLARTLLLLAGYGARNQPERATPRVSQQMLAEMIGTTRSRVNFFMNRFRKLGFIQYDNTCEIHVDQSLLSVVLQDSFNDSAT